MFHSASRASLDGACVMLSAAQSPKVCVCCDSQRLESITHIVAVFPLPVTIKTKRLGGCRAVEGSEGGHCGIEGGVCWRDSRIGLVQGLGSGLFSDFGFSLA